MARIPSVKEMYGGDESVTDGVPTPQNAHGTPKPGKLAERHETFVKAMNSAVREGLEGDVLELPPDGGSSRPIYKSRRLYQKEIANAAGAGGLKKQQGQLVAEHLDELLKSDDRMAKEFTLSFPLSTGFVPFDLSAPARLLFPINTPLRNQIPRVQGQGAAYRFKVLDGISGSGTGGLTSLDPGFAENATTVTPGSGLNLVRPNYLSYSAYDVVQSFVTSGLSDSVTFQAAYQGEGFDDVRGLSATSLLYASFLAEERVIINGRGTTGNGYAGALGTPSITSCTAVSASVAPGGTSSLGSSATVWVIVAADAGDLTSASGQLHQGPATTVGSSASVTTSAGLTAVQVNIGSDVTGALGYNLYAASVQAGPYYYAGRTGYNVGYITSQPSSGPTITSAAADQSARATSYDGFFANTAASGGYVKRLNSTLSTTSPGSELQTCFASLWDAVKGDPDTVQCNGYDRLQLSNALLNGPNVNSYRVMIPNDQMGNVTVGALVQNVTNEVTGKSVEIMVHPWQAQGNMLVRQHTLPLPHANISQTAEMAVVQDYVQLQWPVMGMTYDSSTFWISTLAHNAPQWQGVISGIVGTGVPATFPSDSDS
jgi:hypothetical protein